MHAPSHVAAAKILLLCLDADVKAVVLARALHKKATASALLYPQNVLVGVEPQHSTTHCRLMHQVDLLFTSSANWSRHNAHRTTWAAAQRSIYNKNFHQITAANAHGGQQEHLHANALFKSPHKSLIF